MNEIFIIPKTQNLDDQEVNTSFVKDIAKTNLQLAN